jgi:hypothetical protein
MNRGNGRLVVCASLALLIGCGARTSTLEEELGGQNAGGAAGGAGLSSGNGGAPPTPGGGPSTGGVSAAGAPATGGAGTGGSYPFPGGGAPAAGAPVGGSGGISFAGAPAGGFGGSFGGFGGSFAGFGAIGGEAGTGGVAELCSVLGNSSCAECQCKTCAPAIDACFADIGCALIFLCAQQTGCNGISCYSPTTCQSVIDQSGGLAGKSLARVFALAACSLSSQSSCGCN